MESFIIAFIIGGFVLGRFGHRPEPRVIYVQIPADEQDHSSGFGSFIFAMFIGWVCLRMFGVI